MSTAFKNDNNGIVKLEVRNLSKVFNNKLVVNDISFTANQGEIVGFLGPNGAGKTTSMRMITGFLKPNSGSILINGTDIATNPVLAKQQFGYLPEGAPSYVDMSVYDSLEFVAKIRGYSGTNLVNCLETIIKQVNLETVLNKTVDQLSKGFKRRLGLAQAILHNPPILILDEPTDGLDPNQKHEVRELIKIMAKDKVIILSTHILEEVAAICNRVMVIVDGRIISDAPPCPLGELETFFRKITKLNCQEVN